MIKKKISCMFIYVVVIILSLTACSNVDYVIISNGVMTVDYDKAVGDITDYSKRLARHKKTSSEINKMLNRNEEPIHTLVLHGKDIHSECFNDDGFSPIAESIIELSLTVNFDRVSQFDKYPNLQILRLDKLDLFAQEVDDFLNFLNNHEHLQELYINEISRSFMDKYLFFAERLIENNSILTVNGRPLAEWDPTELLDDGDRFSYLISNVVSDASEMLKQEYDSYTYSDEAYPDIFGKVIFGLLNNSLAFENLPHTNHVEEAFPASLEECTAIIAVRITDQVAGKYTDGTTGYRGIYYLEVIDPVNKIRYEPIYFQTVEPPDTKPSSLQDRYGRDHVSWESAMELILSHVALN